MVRLPDLKEAGDIPGADFGGFPTTYIPLRNGVFYSFAASIAEEVGASAIAGGHNRDDVAVFPDVSTRFFQTLERAFWAGSPTLRKRTVRILRPLRGLGKVQVIRAANSIGVPLELTWSCHRDGKSHCWHCTGCRSRTDSFMKAGIEDPLGRTRGKLLKG